MAIVILAGLLHRTLLNLIVLPTLALRYGRLSSATCRLGQEQRHRTDEQRTTFALPACKCMTANLTSTNRATLRASCGRSAL